MEVSASFFEISSYAFEVKKKKKKKFAVILSEGKVFKHSIVRRNLIDKQNVMYADIKFLKSVTVNSTAILYIFVKTIWRRGIEALYGLFAPLVWRR